MKNIFKLLSIAILFSACDDFINLEPENAVTYTNAMETPTEMEAILSHAQAAFQNVFTNMYMQEYAGAYCNGAVGGGMGPSLPADAMHHLWNNSMVDNGYWGGHYSVIGYANIIQSNIKTTWPKDRTDYFLGQAHFLKGITYFDLARRWGEAPIVPDNDYEAPIIGKSSCGTLLKKAVDEALMAYNLLERYEDLKFSDGVSMDNKQYANKEIAACLLAYIYAWKAVFDDNVTASSSQECWTNSEKYASMLIDPAGSLSGYATLESDIASLTSGTLNSRRGKEAILELEYDTKYNKVMHKAEFYIANKTFGYPYKHNSTSGDEIQMTVSCKRILDLYGETSGDIRKTEWFDLSMYDASAVFEWPDSEPRVEYVEFFPGFGMNMVVGGIPRSAVNRAYVKKYTKQFIYSEDPTQTASFYNFDINKIIWRLSDLLLLRAEVRANLGNTAGATDDLNTIRRRAGADLFPAATDTDGLQKAIFVERERELIFENHRFFDVLRNKDYYKTELPAAFRVLTEQEVKDGALYLPISRDGGEYNKQMTPNKYWYLKSN